MCISSLARVGYIVTPSEPGSRTFHHGFESAQRLLAVCFNDPLAVGAMEAVLATGLRMPQDVAIIGCGNLPLGATLRNPLSTINQNTKELGEKAVHTTLLMLQKKSKRVPERVDRRAALIGTGVIQPLLLET